MEQAEDIIRNLLHVVADENHYTNYTVIIKPVSSGGANYSSRLFTATLSAPEKDDLHLFAKVLHFGNEIRNTIAPHVATIEHCFYGELLKKYREIEDEYEIDEEHRLKAVKLYANSTAYKKETLVLENLSVKGFQSFDRFKAIDWAYVTASLKQLALFHALSVAFSRENFSEYDNIVKTKLNLKLGDLMIKVIPKTIDMLLQVVKAENIRKLRNFLAIRECKSAVLRLFEACDLPFIIHGDFRPSNMMHKTCHGGRTQVIALDYQTLQLGHPVTDLLYFLLTGSDKQFRQRYLRKSFDFYHRELSAALERFGLEPSQIYSKEDYELDIKKMLPDMLIYCFLIIMIVTVDETDAPQVREEFVMEDFAVTPSALYVERINDLIDDCIAMGVL